MIFAVLVLGVLQAIAAVNIAVDPFGYFGLNQAGIFFNSEREFKQQQVHIYPHRGLLLGNSKMAYVDPDQLPGYDFFNAAFAAAEPAEMLAFLEAHLEDQELIAMALDHHMFMAHQVRELEIRHPHWSDWLRYSLSLDLLVKSFQTIGLWLHGLPSSYKANGARTTVELQARDYAVDGIAYWDKLDQREEEYAGLEPEFWASQVEVFRRMKRLLDRHGVDHVVFMSPLNIHEQEAIDWREEWLQDPAYRDLVADLTRIFPEFRDYTSSRFSSPDGFWPTDFKHYRPEVGAAIIREMLEAKGIRPRGGG